MASEHAVESVDATPPWRRLGRGTVVPILLLLGLLFVLGQLHVDLAQGYTAPRVVADERGGYAFWDEGGSEPTFCLRHTEDGQTWTRKRRVPGILAGVALGPEQVFALHAGGEEPGSWFCRVSSRKELEPLWTRTFSEPELGLHHPRHMARVGEQVHVFGTDRGGALRAVRVAKGQQLLPVAAQLPAAAVAPLSSDVAPPAPDKVPPPVAFASAEEDESSTVLAWRVLVDPAQGRQGKGELRWARFDGSAFGPIGRAPEDLAAFALVKTTGFGGPDARVLLLGVPPGDSEPRVKVWALGPDGFEPRSEVLDYPREGFGQAGLASISLAELRGRLIVLAQIGGAIRWRVRDEQGRWGPWEDFARLPAEQRAVVYGWFGSVLLLCGALVWHGGRMWRDRRRRGLAARAGAAAPAVQAEPVHASLLERGLAFGVDLLLLTGLASLLLGPLGPLLGAEELERSDARRQLSLAVLALAGGLGWLAAWEGLARRTPGKWLIGLEVADQDGGRPATWALVLRNLFRIELLLPPQWLAGLVTLTVMLVTPRHQRPGDLVARTVVVRSGGRAPAAA